MRSPSAARSFSTAGAHAAPLIMVAEDHEDARELAVLILADAGYRTLHVADGREAVASASIFLPDALVLDLGMPRLDGVTAIETLRSSPATAHLPIVVVSGQGEDAIARARAAGATAAVAKPCAPERLLELVRAALASGPHGWIESERPERAADAR